MNAHVSSFRRAGALFAVTLCALGVAPLEAQATSPAPGQQNDPAPPQVSPYRRPVITLVQPGLGVSVPNDRPVVVFRFLPGEPLDPIDATSLRVSVNGSDRTSLFQATAAEAWGPLGPLNDGAPAIVEGPHDVIARICSVRGACSEVAATVHVAASRATGNDVKPSEGRRSLVDVLIEAARKLLRP